MTHSRRAAVFVMFFASGFCGLLYQIVWLRKALAAFGVITPVVSLVVSIFMLGLALGSWLGGRYVGSLVERFRCSPIVLYGTVELGIGVGALLVPMLFSSGANSLLGLGESDSLQYLAASAIVICFSILPWCVCMGATFPFVMAYIKSFSENCQSSFSYLYLANILGAITGVCSTGAFLIELLGFSFTLKLAGSLNAAIASTAFILGFVADKTSAMVMKGGRATSGTTVADGIKTAGFFVPVILFATGFCSMAMEVVWTRAFTPITTTTIYAFVLLLATYLIATSEGLLIYRRHLSAGNIRPIEKLLAILAVTSFLPLLVVDPRLHPTALNFIIGILPFCAGLGYLTPMLIDRHCTGSPQIAGKLYAINIVGCILGPLFAGYILMPAVGSKWSLLVLSLPFTVLFLAKAEWPWASRRPNLAWITALFAVILVAPFCKTYEDSQAGPESLLLRDHTATVIAQGSGMARSLQVNGIHTTYLTPITKVMAHLPLATVNHKPESALIICFGMGTTYRSALSWGVKTTAVELVPSVKRAFGYFVSNAPQLLDYSSGKVIIDDGRRYLQRTREKYDVITIDPPPPVEAAGSSLLYSEEFYRLAQAHLQDGGILQQWFPGGEDKITRAVAGALVVSFPYVKVFRPLSYSGFHFLASTTPISVPSANQMIDRMPEAAKNDLMEWFPGVTCEQAIENILNREIGLKDICDPASRLTITDDRPLNEYFAVRRNMVLLKDFLWNRQ